MKWNNWINCTCWLLGCLFASSSVAAEQKPFECLMEPMRIIEVGSPVQGVIKQLLVDRSDFVTRGQAIIELEAEAENINLAAANARASMQSEVSAREADLVLAKLNLARMQKLQEQNLVPTQKWDEARAQQQVAAAALVQALENLKIAQIDAQRALHSLAQKTIRSPIDGVVVAQQAFAGEFVYDNPLMTLAQLDPLRIEVVLPARLFGSFKPGDTALIRPEIDHAEPLQATIQVVDRLLDTRSGTFGVRLTLPNPQLSIPGGQKCQLEFQSDVVLVTSEQ
ncbi:efflux RND transporter periplasmic adaptor subunit [Granulosicoccus antarcticus]|uniref:Cobalt-zinc-cadmium resistance protein CzcB n=1 Tax=Granulosicoccus antarcticus IMCC3135 TaxID=1192854 RepID=A0A2Z2NH57_9GAMM|nr:efflux RND transporter periplasmic adaptor subunit [Granulosicoccus antarcticus]ASJ70626.1 Cobalt-zinc-cadmium resistance protein CzcB [Granulosicoccus antarcticus IMCC3135]